MSRVLWTLVLLSAAVGGTPSYAQILTEQKFLEDALLNHPGIAAVEANVDVASGLRRQAGVIDNPEISWEREDPDLAPRQDTLRLNWRLPFDGRQHRLAAADAEVAASHSDVEVALLVTRLEMRSLFASWYIATERELILAGNLSKTRQLADWLRARAEEGEAAGVQARRLDLEVEVLQRETVAARAQARARRSAAAAWSSLVTGTNMPARPFLPVAPSTVGVGDRADLRALAHRVAAAESIHQLRKRRIEPPEISVGWTEIRDSLQSFDGPVLGLSWPLPVFDRNQGARDATSAELEKARFELELARRRAMQQAKAALASYAELYEMAKSADPSASEGDIPSAMFAAFEAGEASLTDVLDALRATVAVEMARLATLADALQAERELEAALGRPDISGENS